MKLEDAEKILKFYENELRNAPCSTNHHLNKRGGLMIHMKNAFGIAKFELRGSETLQALALIHDVGKARTYTIRENIDAPGIDEIKYAYPAVDHLINTIAMIAESGYHLTQEELHALEFHHGGFSPFAKGTSINMTQLAVNLHYCDLLATSREDSGKNWH